MLQTDPLLLPVYSRECGYQGGNCGDLREMGHGLRVTTEIRFPLADERSAGGGQGGKNAKQSGHIRIYCESHRGRGTADDQISSTTAR